MIDSYFVSYFSNQSSNYFKENKSYKFNVFLPHETFFPRELTQKKLIVGLKALSFQFTNDANNPSIIGLKSSLIDQSNKTDDQILFMTQVSSSEKVQYFSVSHPLYFVTNRQRLATPSFEFTTYNSESGKFEALPPNILREDIIVHVQVEIKAVDTSMDLQHFNVLVSSSDKESAKMFPTNKPYDFTILKRFEFPENEKWVMGLKSLIIPSLIQNAELPDFGISYRLEMIPKDRQFYLPFVETYSGSLPQKHFNSVEHFFACLSEMLKKISMIYNAFKVENNNKLKVAHPLYLVYKASLLKRPPPPPSPPPSPQVEIRDMQESDEERDPGDIDLPSPDEHELEYMVEDNVELEARDIDLPPPNTEELGLMDEDNNYTEGEDNLEMEAANIESPSTDLEDLASMLDQLGLMDKDNKNYTEGDTEMEANDIELPSPDPVELASMLDEDSNNNTEGEDNMEPADDNVDPDTGEMEVNEIEQETVMDDDDRKSNEIQKDNNEETSMDVIQNNTTFKRTISDDEDDDDKNNKKPFAKNERNKIQKDNNNKDTGREVQDNKTFKKRVREESKKNEISKNKIQKDEEKEKVEPTKPKRRWRRKKNKKEKNEKQRNRRSVEDTADQKWDNALDYTMAEEILANDLAFDHLFFPTDNFEPDEKEKFVNEKVKESFKIDLAQTKATHTFKLHFELSEMLAKMIGISEENRSIQVSDDELYNTLEKAYCQVTEETNFNFSIPQTILLNCDLIEESLVGNKKLPLLKHIFLGDKVLERDRQHQFNFNIDQWYEVKMKNTSRFNLSVTDLLGNQISLQEDQHRLSTIVELIFKKVNHEYNY